MFLVKGRRTEGAEAREYREIRTSNEQRFRYPAEEVWEVSCVDEDRRKPAPRTERHVAG